MAKVCSRSLVTWLLATKGTKGMLSSSEVRFRRQGRKFLPMEGQSEGSVDLMEGQSEASVDLIPGAISQH